MPAAVLIPLITATIGAAGSLAAGAMNKRGDFSDAMEKQSNAMEKQRNVEIAQQNEQAARERRSQIREARIQRAMVENTAAATGQDSGSAAISGGQNATAQAGINIGNINTAQAFSGAMSNARQGVADAQNEGDNPFASLLGGVGISLLNAGLSKTTETIFK